MTKNFWSLKRLLLAFLILSLGIVFAGFIVHLVTSKINLRAENEKMVSFLKVYSAYDKNGQLKLIRLGKDNDGGYAVPVKILKSTDVLMSYGIADDSSFEEQFSEMYKKPSYGFDCGVSQVVSKNKLFTFVNECITSDRFLYKGQETSQKITSFSQQLKHLGLTNKKIFIKMDIEGAEYEALDDVLKHPDNIMGVVLEIHFKHLKETIKAVKLLSMFDKNFLLLRVHGNNYSRRHFTTKQSVGKIPRTLELTYINKSLVTKYELSQDQKHPAVLDMPNKPGKKDSEFEILLK